jgi:hypothetical protein
MQARSPAGKAPAADARRGAGFPADSDRDDEMDVLYLAGQQPAGPGECGILGGGVPEERLPRLPLQP